MARIEILYNFKTNDFEWFNHLNTAGIIQVWNGMFDYMTPISGGRVYRMGELDQHFESVRDFAQATVETRFNPCSKWFWVDSKGNAHSINHIDWEWPAMGEALHWAIDPSNYDRVIDIQRKGKTLDLEEDHGRYTACKMLRKG